MPVRFGQQVVQSVHVCVRKHTQIRAAQLAAINDAGVVFPIAVDRIARPNEGRDCPHIGCKSRGEEKRRLTAFELR